MGIAISSKYNINQVPLLWKPLYYVLSYSIGLLFYFYFYIIRLTCSLNLIGLENLKKNQNYIFCHWHTFSPHFYPHFIFKNFKHAWLSHPVWAMKPVLIPLTLMGVEKFIYGSSGNSGKQATKNLIPYLKKGYSTVMMPDGPSGPIFVAKKGVLHLAQQSGIPIMPIRFISSKNVQFNTWDKKKFPLPFSKIVVEFGSDLQVSENNMEESYKFMCNFLNFS